MLVFSRRKGEQIVVSVDGTTILIQVVETRGSQVRVGITAPPEVVVHRQEVWRDLLPADPEKRPAAS